MKQQIDSYNYFINIGIKKIMEANKEIRSDVNHKFFVQYQNIYLGDPMVLEDSQIINNKVGVLTTIEWLDYTHGVSQTQFDLLRAHFR